MFITRANAEVDWAAAEHLLSPLSSPFLRVNWLYDYGFYLPSRIQSWAVYVRSSWVGKYTQPISSLPIYSGLDQMKGCQYYQTQFMLFRTNKIPMDPIYCTLYSNIVLTVQQ